jgi:PAS domain S-box-containing protein
MLRLDLAYVRLTSSEGGSPMEFLEVVPDLSPAEIGTLLSQQLGDDARNWPDSGTISINRQNLAIAALRLGLDGGAGVLVAGSRRAGFPQQTEHLLLGVAANQAAIGLRESEFLDVQRQIADELDRKVEQRTSELGRANAELKLQLGLLQTIPVAAWTLRPDGCPDFVNENWLEYTGQTFEYVCSAPEAWMTAVHPEDRGAASGAFWKGIRSGRGFAMETRVLRAADATYRWHLNRAVALRDPQGNVVKFVGTSTDIEDLKRSQENLRSAEEKNRLIIDSALDAVVTMDSDGVVTGWNKQAGIIFGWSRSEAIGRQMSELIIPDRDRTAHARGMRHFLATGEGRILGRRIEVTALRRDGFEFPVELEVVPVRVDRNWIFSAFIRDITEAKYAQEKLQESELHLRQMSETIPEMLWSAGAEGKIDYCNARVLDYTGFTAAEIRDGGWAKLLHPDDVELAARAWSSSVATGSPFRVEVRTYNSADRTYRLCVTSALPLSDRHGRVLKWYGTIVDMHDWKQAQEELRNTQAELAHVSRAMTVGALTASIAHEVNQPLAGIITNANTCLRMLAADPPNVDGARETARRTIRDGYRASDVITRLRALYSNKTPAAETLDLNDAAREVVALSLSELERNNVILRLELDDALPPISGDRVQLQQVVLNLIRNASDAMIEINDRPRQLMLKTLQLDENQVCLSVQDAGIGIEPEGINKLFKAFYTTKSDGMGIGLSVSRFIIQSHRGRLWATRNSGPGSTFAFAIPCKTDSDETESASGPADFGISQNPGGGNTDRAMRTP